MNEEQLAELEEYIKNIEVRAIWPSIDADQAAAELATGLIRYQFSELFRLARIGLLKEKE